MAGLIQKLFPKAAAAGKTIVLPEGNDPRVIKAAKLIAENQLAKVKILATSDEYKKASEGVCLCGCSNIEIIDWNTADCRQQLAGILFERRKAKGMTEEEALKKVANRLFFGNLMVNAGLADGMVAGSIASTGDMLRSAFNCIGTAKGIKLASSCFLMDLATPTEAGNEQLKVAYLCCSTKGSAAGDLVTKMQTAAEMTKQRVAELGIDALVDGELQADAALVASVGASKAPGSDVAGQANILIFPDLNCGNICYKMTQRLAKAEAYGPILQGVAKPVNDLSRGCSAEDICGVAAITACQAAAL